MSSATPAPLYLDWGFWSMIVALAALLLSQLPPIRELLRKPRLHISLPDTVALTNDYAKLIVEFFLDVENDGGKTAAVTRVRCLLVDPADRILDLQARTYLFRNAPPNPLGGFPEARLGTILLNPGKNWSEHVRCFALNLQHEEADLQKLFADALREIHPKATEDMRAFAMDPNAPLQPPVFSENTLQRATTLFEQRRLVLGTYKLAIIALTREGGALASEAFSFTLYETDVKKLNMHLTWFKLGVGYVFPPVPGMLSTQVRLAPLSQDEARVFCKSALSRVESKT